MKKLPKNQSGQTLLFVIMTMAIALSVGVGVSLRTISSISRATLSDSATRALAAAEGAAEYYLAKTDEELDDLAAAGSPVTIQYAVGGDDKVSASAYVTVEEYGQGRYVEFLVNQDTVFEVNLDGYTCDTVNFCWSSKDADLPSCQANPDSCQRSDIYYLSYNYSNIPGDIEIEKGGAAALGGAVGGGYETDIPDGQSYLPGAGICGDLTNYDFTSTAGLPSNPVGIRFKALNYGAKMVVSASGSCDTLPIQGFKITSIGKVGPMGGETEAIKTVVVRRAYPFYKLPALFDFGIYSETGNVP